MTAYEDKTGKLVNITRDSGSIILEEDVTGKTATITLDGNGKATSVVSDTGSFKETLI